MTRFESRIRFPKSYFVHMSLAAAIGLTISSLSGCGGSGDGNSGTTGSDSSSTNPTPPATVPSGAKASDSSGSAAPNPGSAPTGATLASGPAAPPFTLSQVGGGKLSLASLKGKVVLLDFWATWCVPCMAELPEFQQLYTKYKGQGLVVVGMTGVTGFPSPPGQVTTTQKSRHLTFPLVNTDSAVETAYHTGSQIPASVLIDRQGHIVEEVHAAPSPSALQFWSPLIEKALKG